MDLAPDSPWAIDEMYILLRLLLAILLGGLIGYERESSNHSAGLRTNILVCMGSCLLMLLSIYGFTQFISEPNVRVDPARLAAAVITGIGFLGAGTIAFTGKSITGLTTAASVWVVTGIGLAVGAGFYFAAITSTILVYLTLWALNKLEKRYMNGKQQQMVKIHADAGAGVLERFGELLKQRGIVLRKISVYEQMDDIHPQRQQVMQALLSLPKAEAPMELFETIKRMPGVHAVDME